MRNLLSWIVIAVVIGFCGFAHAAQQAIVSIDGAMVYKDASFDSPVIAYLKKGKQVRVSSKGFGPFYRIMIGNEQYGYISDIDVQILSGGSARDEDDGEEGTPRKSRRSKRDDGEDDEMAGDDEEGDEGEDGEDSWDEAESKRDKKRKQDGMPIFVRRFIGGQGGILNFKETISDQKVSSNLKVVGAKITGPNLLFSGPYIFDINLFMSLGVPTYYGEISRTAPSGFLIGADALLIFPYHVPAHESWALYFGLGPIIVYSKFNVTVTQNSTDIPLDLQDLKIGASIMAGFSYELTRDLVAKIEPKFVFEKNSYFGFFGSIQKEFR